MSETEMQYCFGIFSTILSMKFSFFALIIADILTNREDTPGSALPHYWLPSLELFVIQISCKLLNHFHLKFNRTGSKRCDIEKIQTNFEVHLSLYNGFCCVFVDCKLYFLTGNIYCTPTETSFPPLCWWTYRVPLWWPMFTSWLVMKSRWKE